MTGVPRDQCLITSVAGDRRRDLDAIVSRDLEASQSSAPNRAALMQFEETYPPPANACDTGALDRGLTSQVRV